MLSDYFVTSPPLDLFWNEEWSQRPIGFFLRFPVSFPSRVGKTPSEVGKIAFCGEESPNDDFMVQLRDYLVENLNEPELNSDKIARYFGLSRSQLYRKIRSLTDVSLVEMLQKIRCERAISILWEQRMSVCDVAYTVGFSSPSYFSKTFKRHFGISPSELISKVILEKSV